jgi:hypothetical protein
LKLGLVYEKVEDGIFVYDGRGDGIKTKGKK